MSHSFHRRMAERIPVEFVEADLEIGFSLVDIAEGEDGRAIQDAEDVFRDIEQRLLRLTASDGAAFAPLVGELRRAIDLAKQRHGAGW